VSGSQTELRRRLLPGYLKYAGEIDEVAGTVYARWNEEQVWCPHCGALYPIEAGDGDDDLISYHGEESPIEKTCEACGKLFFVKEHVTRTYTSGLTADEAEG